MTTFILMARGGGDLAAETFLWFGVCGDLGGILYSADIGAVTPA